MLTANQPIRSPRILAQKSGTSQCQETAKYYINAIKIAKHCQKTKYSGASSNSAPLGSKQNCRLKQSVGLSNSVYRENREMGARKTAGLSRDSAYEGAGLAAPLLY